MGVGEVGGEDQAFPAGGDDPVSGRFQAVDAAGRDRHLGAFGGEPDGDRRPGASLARPGDQGHLARASAVAGRIVRVVARRR